jgi:hypothetical protein
MKSSQAVAPRRLSVALRFKADIERAASDGVLLGDMALHLTLGDVEQLKRDRTVPMADISFTDGTMKYLGVEVVKGNVPLSVLRCEGADRI